MGGGWRWEVTGVDQKRRDCCVPAILYIAGFVLIGYRPEWMPGWTGLAAGLCLFTAFLLSLVILFRRPMGFPRRSPKSWFYRGPDSWWDNR